ncbi:prolyl oligopeptidase family serine peptidase [Pedobacter sp. JY14-1]|uniref:alpha/beta hydrolase family protein n=1 Tax=Pedobacter sp. JY14-1 TaxID=3034151 RepID=UPI0023E20408|nr:prolyl oligopeptidase family serine peptidase [Pedobacter sp. JY14-1]
MKAIKIKLLAIALTLIFKHVSHGQKYQKPAINNETYKTWQSCTGAYGISNDGKYVWYEISGALNTEGTLFDKRSLVLQSVTKGKDVKFNISGPVNHPLFSEDNKEFITLALNDSLVIINLKSKESRIVPNVYIFDLCETGGSKYLITKQPNKICVQELKTGNLKEYNGYSEYVLDKRRNFLYLQGNEVLRHISLTEKTDKTIFNGNYKQVTLNEKNGMLAFYGSPNQSLSLHTYDPTTGIVNRLRLSSIENKRYKLKEESLNFTRNGRYLIFSVLREVLVPEKGDLISRNVEVWHYRDRPIFPALIVQSEGKREWIRCAYDLISNEAFQVEDDTFKLQGFGGNIEDDYILLANETSQKDIYWDDSQIPSTKLFSLSKRGFVETFLPSKAVMRSRYLLSPTSKFVLWCDTAEKAVYSYEVATQIKRKLSDNAISGFDKNKFSKYIGFPLWGRNDMFFLWNDGFDIWKIDPMALSPVVCVTKGFGKRNNIKIGIVSDKEGYRFPSDTLLVSGINQSTKWNGFLQIILGTTAKLKITEFSPSWIYFTNSAINNIPLKAKKAETYVMLRQTADSSPNIVVSDDFKSYRRISNIYPEKAYNWLSSELVKWERNPGDTIHGILYKPENFDASKKYPIIFHYYQLKSDELFQFHYPVLSGGALEIPWYVSNGYLVFVPDIPPTIGPSRGSLLIKTIESAANYLTHHFSFIDPLRMGLQGHSFGGWETNYIVTHSNLFAAANPSASISNLTSLYGGLAFGNNTLTNMMEEGQSNLGISLADGKGAYVENSPLFAIKSVTTPILLMHAEEDRSVPFAQAQEMFISLRRHKKKVWLLNYKKEHHVLNSPENRLDFTIRQQQFFDHYLKGKPAPLWMVEGIAPKYQNIKSGLQLDSLNRTP